MMKKSRRCWWNFQKAQNLPSNLYCPNWSNPCSQECAPGNECNWLSKSQSPQTKSGVSMRCWHTSSPSDSNFSNMKKNHELSIFVWSIFIITSKNPCFLQISSKFWGISMDDSYVPGLRICTMFSSSDRGCLNQPILKNIRHIGSCRQVGVNIEIYVWKHHPAMVLGFLMIDDPPKNASKCGHGWLS